MGIVVEKVVKNNIERVNLTEICEPKILRSKNTLHVLAVAGSQFDAQRLANLIADEFQTNVVITEYSGVKTKNNVLFRLPTVWEKFKNLLT